MSVDFQNLFSLCYYFITFSNFDMFNFVAISKGINITPGTIAAASTQHRQSVCNSSCDRSRPPSRDGSDRRMQERAPMPKEAKRLFKQKSQESFKDNNKSVTSIPYIDASPPSVASNGLVIGKASTNTTTTPTHCSNGKGKCILRLLWKNIADGTKAHNGLGD